MPQTVYQCCAFYFYVNNLFLITIPHNAILFLDSIEKYKNKKQISQSHFVHTHNHTLVIGSHILIQILRWHQEVVGVEEMVIKIKIGGGASISKNSKT